MPNENRSENHWRNKLEDVNAFSAEIFAEKNTAWEKLYKRLHHKPQRLRITWYWLAAACLLPAIILPIMMADKKQEVFIKNFPGNVSSVNATITDTFSTPAPEIAISPSLKINKKINETSAHTGSKKVFLKKDVKIEETASVIGDDKKNIQTEPANDPVIDTTKTIAVAPVKQKLRVVHVNDLDPIESSLNITRNNERRAHHLKFINPEVYTSFSLPEGRTGFTILKQKQVPSN